MKRKFVTHQYNSLARPQMVYSSLLESVKYNFQKTGLDQIRWGRENSLDRSEDQTLARKLQFLSPKLNQCLGGDSFHWQFGLEMVALDTYGAPLK